MAALLLCLAVLVLLPVDAKLLVKKWQDLRCTFDVGNCHRRTVIAIHKGTYNGEYLYLRGGAYGTGKPIPIRHRVHPENAGTYFGEMSRNDKTLSWRGREKDQGHYKKEKAEGTPMMWTTNLKNYPYRVEKQGAGYYALNTMGSHYWMVDLDMDCDQLGKDGLFEFKGILVNRRRHQKFWDYSHYSRKKCGSNVKPSRWGNHVGRCGMMNIVEFKGWGCDVIKPIP